MRSYNRTAAQARPIELVAGFTGNADGSVLVTCGNTKVICTAFLEEKVPPFLKNSGNGWVTAEYGMLPSATHTRSNREAARGKQSGRTMEIQRLIGRSLRLSLDTAALGERSITIDCDVIQADGGTRTAAITGGCTALILCLWKYRKKFIQPLVTSRIAAISLGIRNGETLVDLDYEEDSSAEVDLNLVMTQAHGLVEVQGTAEKRAFSPEDLAEMVRMGREALDSIFALQAKVLLEQGVSPAWVL